MQYVRGIMATLGAFVLYIVPCVTALVLVRLLTRLPSFVFRKLLHVVAVACVLVAMLAAGSWQVAAATSVLLAALLHPVLRVMERVPWYAGFFVEKGPGEIRQSMLMLFLMFAAVVAVAWGGFGQPYVAVAAILMWGAGDAAAALVGVPYGRHKVRWAIADGKKSWEGSLAMLATSFACGLGVLVAAQGMSLPRALACAVVSAAVGTLVELVSPSRYDTVTVPLALALVLLPLAA